jgi:hypothetical protein
LLGGTSIPILILGAGVSYGLVPNPKELFPTGCQQAERKIGCCSGIDYDNQGGNDLYSWAESIVNELEQRGEPLAKLRIAKELGILSDPRWQPRVSCRALQNLPRHRIIARFVREKRWKAIWSLNWDTYLETALESIGICCDTNSTLNNFPWITKYRTFVTEADYAVSDDVFKLHKPHGCVRSLIQAKKELNIGNPHGKAEQLSERFLVTRSEMASLSHRATSQDHNFYSNIRDAFSGRSLYTFGWKAEAEGYILESLTAISSQLRTDFEDGLCVINRSFYDEGGHGRLASIYGKTREEAFVEVEKGFCSDDLLLWLQARYLLGKLLNWTNGVQKTLIQEIVDSIASPAPATQRLLYDWADCLLPAWMRLCWRAGLVECRNSDDQLIEPHDIRLETPDEHIPLSLIPNPDRTDLKSAIPLLLSVINGNANLDLRKYPGGIYRVSDCTLIVPLPGWETDYNDLEGLKPLIEEVRQSRGFGFVEKIAVLPLGHDSAPVVDEAQHILPQKLAHKLDILAFAKEGAITVISLDEVSGGSHV